MPPSEADVRRALAPVTDPELDQSILELGFVHAITIDGSTVTIGFRLPTFWCSANFAFIMAEDMRDALKAVPGIDHVRIRLEDHFAAAKINAGIEEGRGFRAVFGNEAADDLQAVRRTFEEKARLGRQAALIRELRDQGWPDSRIVGLTRAELDDLPPSEARDRYRAILEPETPPEAPAITDTNGQPVPSTALADHLRTIRRIRTSAESNGEMCRILLKARYAREEERGG